jgi:hypothetical protein
MNLRSLAVLFALAGASFAARAQGGVYAMFDAQQFTRTGLLATPPAGSSNSDSPWLYGTTFGAYYMFTHVPVLGTLHTGPIAIGLDGRGTIVRTNTPYNRDDGTISVRISTKNTFATVKPYVQGGAGIGHTKVPGQTFFANDLSYIFAVGADRRLSKRVDWRVVDVSGGFLGNYQSGNNVSNTNHILNFATGLVVRFP